MARLGVAGSSRNRPKWIAKVASSTIEPNYSEIKGLRSGDAESLPETDNVLDCLYRYQLRLEPLRISIKSSFSHFQCCPSAEPQ
jgi:hypothetical protein